MARRHREDQGLGHNGGPPLEDKPHIPEWGTGGIGTYFWWKKAHRAVWRSPSRGTQLWRLEKAEALGLTYEEYTLEIMERGRFLGPDDVEAVAAIRARRKGKKRRAKV